MEYDFFERKAAYRLSSFFLVFLKLSHIVCEQQKEAITMQREKEEKLLLSIKEASELTGVSQQSMRNLSYELKIQVRIGRRVLVNRKKLEKWINQQTR